MPALTNVFPSIAVTALAASAWRLSAPPLPSSRNSPYRRPKVKFAGLAQTMGQLLDSNRDFLSGQLMSSGPTL
jgi:hypothetical protein